MQSHVQSNHVAESDTRLNIRRPESPPQHNVMNTQPFGSVTRDSGNAAQPSRRNQTGTHSPELTEPPRIPHYFNHASPGHAADQRPKGTWDHHFVFPSPQEPQAEDDLRSASSTGSLRAQDSDGTPTKRRNRLLPFRKKFVGSWKEVASPSLPDSPWSSGNPAALPAAGQNDHSRTPPRHIDLAQQPVEIKPAAAKRLGIENGDPVTVGSQSGSSSLATHQSSRNPSQSSSMLLTAQATKAGHALLKRKSDGPSLPDHTIAPLHTHDFKIPEDSFYFSSSDSNDEEEEDLQSGNSCRSSHTSYNLITPVDSESKEFQECFRDAVDQRLSNGRSPVRSRHSNSNQSPKSASGSHRTGMPSPPASRPTSFSRPFSRPPSARSSTFSSSLDSSSGMTDTNSQPPQLTAIREDSPIQTAEPFSKPSGEDQIEAKVMNSAKNRPPSSANPPRPRASGNAKPVKTTNPPQPPQPPSPSIPYRRVPATSAQSKSAIDRTEQITASSVVKHKSARPLSLAIKHDSEASLSSESAEVIILRIFEYLGDFRDLFACARVNQGFFQVFKRHELRLMKNALRNMSPAQWEFREASPKEIIPTVGGPKSDYTPTTYIQFHKRDAFVIKSLKSLMASRCHQYLRYESASALLQPDSARSKRIDDALWRIWTFCTIFGGETGRASDVDAQMEWLRGRNQTDRPTSPESVVLAGAAQSSFLLTQESKSFGRGNYGGLTADELHDMLEAWDCIKDLIKGILGPGRVAQARTHDIFDNQFKQAEADRTEEDLLEEWVYYLRTLGLSTVSDLAHYSKSSSDEVFTVASCMEWTTWTRPECGKSRGDFLQGVVRRLYDEVTGRGKQVTFEEVQQRRKSRGLELAAELREEQEQSMKLSRDTLYQHDDQSVSLWLAWMARAEGAQSITKDEETRDESTHEHKPQTPTQTKPEARPSLREHRSNSALSLFPPQYTRSTPTATPRMSPLSTPLRSRANSMIQPIALTIKQTPPPPLTTTSDSLLAGDRETEKQKQQPFSPRLSMCPEV